MREKVSFLNTENEPIDFQVLYWTMLDLMDMANAVTEVCEGLLKVEEPDNMGKMRLVILGIADMKENLSKILPRA